MSVLSSVVEDLVDLVIDQVKESLYEYAEDLRQDVELFLDRMTHRVAKGIALGLAGAALVSVGLIFALVGVVAYLSEILNPGLAWGIVGIGMMGAGALLLNVLRGRSSRAMRRVSRNGNGR